MWAATFTVLLAVLALFQMPLNRAIRTKARSMSDWILWQSWGNNVVLQPTEENQRYRSIANQSEKTVLHENHEGVIKTYLDPAENWRQEASVSSSAGKGSEALLNTIDINR
jgi:hypothetical protein